MNLTICLLFSCLIFCGARADVSEILANTNNHHPAEEIQACIVLTTNPHHDPEANTVLPEHGPVPSSSSVDIDVKAVPEVPDDSDAVVVASDGQQLDSSHPDFDGPYHYKKPQVLLEYGAPLATDVPPEGRNEDIEVKDYLPPFKSDNSVQAEKQARLFGQRLL